MDTLDGSDEEEVVVNCDDFGNLAHLVVKCPAGYLLCIVNGAETVGSLGKIVDRM